MNGHGHVLVDRSELPLAIVPAKQRACLALIGSIGVMTLLCSCGPQPPVGDATGGILDWYAATKGQIADAAGDHCARYGKTARVTRTESDKSGGHAIFSCE